jgi:hypothetical protein
MTCPSDLHPAPELLTTYQSMTALRSPCSRAPSSASDAGGCQRPPTQILLTHFIALGLQRMHAIHFTLTSVPHPRLAADFLDTLIPPHPIAQPRSSLHIPSTPCGHCRLTAPAGSWTARGHVSSGGCCCNSPARC